jgi:hypothetical protein
MRPEPREPLERFPDRNTAELAASALEAEGIHAWVESDDVGGQYPGIEGSRGARLFVDEADREAGARALAELEAGVGTQPGGPQPRELGDEITQHAEEMVAGPPPRRLGLTLFVIVVALVIVWALASR